MRAFFDKTTSRFIGALVRIFVMIGGVICLVGYGIFAIIRIGAWPFIPLAPLLGIVLLGISS